MESANLVFKGFYAAVWLTPVIAFCIRNLVKRKKIIFVAFTVIMLSGMLLAISQKYSFVGVETDYLAIMLAYIIFGVAWVQLTTVNVHPIFKPVGFLFLLPLVMAPIVCTFLMFAVMLVLGDFLPVKEMNIESSLVCRLYNYGNTTTVDGGYVVNIYNEFPPLEKEIYSSRISTVGSSVTPEVACNNVYKQAKI